MSFDGTAQQTPYSSNVSNVGTSSAVFLNIGVGARAVSMGGAFTAVANDATALYWNPAGISQCRHPEVTFNHIDWILDIHHEYAGAVLPLDQHSFGIGFTYLGVPDQEVRTIDEPEGTGDFYNASDLALAFSYAFQFTDRFAMGFTAKYIHQQIYNCSGSAGAIDLGAIYQPSYISWLKIGMQIANFGTDIQLTGSDLDQKIDIDPEHNSNNRLPASLDTDAFSLPLIFRFGFAFNILNSKTNKLVTAVDLIHPSNNSESINFGAEYVFRDVIALRTGYQSLFERDYQNSGGLTLGVGLTLYVGDTLVIFDYAYRDFGFLENVSRFSMGLRF
jgi:hypothetical protein